QSFPAMWQNSGSSRRSLRNWRGKFYEGWTRPDRANREENSGGARRLSGCGKSRDLRLASKRQFQTRLRHRPYLVRRWTKRQYDVAYLLGAGRSVAAL